jgi:hypothetical protein
MALGRRRRLRIVQTSDITMPTAPRRMSQVWRITCHPGRSDAPQDPLTALDGGELSQRLKTGGSGSTGQWHGLDVGSGASKNCGRNSAVIRGDTRHANGCAVSGASLLGLATGRATYERYGDAPGRREPRTPDIEAAPSPETVAVQGVASKRRSSRAPGVRKSLTPDHTSFRSGPHLARPGRHGAGWVLRPGHFRPAVPGKEGLLPVVHSVTEHRPSRARTHHVRSSGTRHGLCDAAAGSATLHLPSRTISWAVAKPGGWRFVPVKAA